MIIAIRKEPSGSLYMDKEIYQRMTTFKLSPESFELFKQDKTNNLYTFENIKETIKKETLVYSDDETKKTEVVVTEEIVDMVLVTQRTFTDEQLSQPPYNYTKVEIDDIYSDCQLSDFNNDLTFNIEKYNARKQRELDEEELPELQAELNAISQDLIQAQAGAVIDNLEERKVRFQVVHNRIREIMRKEPRIYNM